jgi:hypothetical protein
MSVKRKEYLFSVNDFNEPQVITDRDAVGLLLVRLIMLDPGSDPLHPTMGVGIKKYRYGLDNLNTLKTAIENQINTFLPQFEDVDVTLILTPDKVCNIEITVNNTVYVYDSNTAPIPITLSDLKDVSDG